MYPEDLKYTSEHEWVRSPGQAESSVRVGITHFAQDALGDIVFASLPEVGTEVEAGTAIGELESTKSVSDVYAPVAGKVVARNEALDGTPELVNSDPYGEVLDGIFDDKVFVVSFVSNVLIAGLIVYLGDQLGVGGQLSTGVIVVLGIRIFSNVAAIRRHLFHA